MHTTKWHLLQQFERKQIALSPFCENTLLTVQNACLRYCVKNASYFSTEISLPLQKAIVYIYNEGRPLREAEWALLTEVEKHLEKIEYLDCPLCTPLALFVKFFP